MPHQWPVFKISWLDDDGDEEDATTTNLDDNLEAQKENLSESS